MSEWIVHHMEIIQILFGSGVLLLMIRITFLLGIYVQKVDALEKSLASVESELKEFRRMWNTLPSSTLRIGQ